MEGNEIEQRPTEFVTIGALTIMIVGFLALPLLAAPLIAGVIGLAGNASSIGPERAWIFRRPVGCALAVHLPFTFSNDGSAPDFSV